MDSPLPETVAMNFNKRKSEEKKLEIRYLEIRLLTKKRPAKIKPRHVGGSSFLQKDRNGNTRKLNACQYM